MTPEKLALANLIARLGLATALEVYEIILSAPTDADAIAALKKAATKSYEDYIAEAKERAKLAGQT